MAQIIRPNFGARAPKAPTQVVNTPAQASDEAENQLAVLKVLEGDALYIISNAAVYKEYLSRVIAKAEMITKYIFSMRGLEKKDDNVELRRGTFQTISLEILCEYVLISDESTWNTQPHYFGAIIREIDERLNLIAEAFPVWGIPRFQK